MKNILVIAPHADDEILGCGATIAKHIRNNDTVYVAIMTNASKGAPELFSRQDVENIRQEARNAHSLLGIKDTFFYDFPAPKLEQFPQYKISNEISTLIKELNIDMLYIPHKGDLHMDHGAIYNASLVASRPFADQSVSKILAYETLSETEWGHPTVENTFIPTFFNKLKDSDLKAKKLAMECFASQLRPFPHPRSIEAIEHLAALRGATVGSYSAEAFVIVRETHAE
ncbi:PIG-L deacetylase family protein [Vibrio splendidus]|uniref:PIG-L deacetylase family protein n=1 Tax=Vibrio splendidus TaxID=29497 RepID=UPI00021C0B9F|nr:PIG-L deacetylase family protein [Vibrio splendidus]EGU40408.1 lmbe family protein [Vibrio splendidus ATCC 33789]